MPSAGRVDRGEFGAGRLLPSESALSTEYGASRVTVRRALEQLRDDGRSTPVRAWVGSSPARRIRQSLARLATLEDQLAASGIRPERRILDFAFVPADERVREVLGVHQVLRVRRLNLADEEPFAIVTVWCPAELGAAAVPRRRRALALLRAAADPTRRRQPDDRGGRGDP